MDVYNILSSKPHNARYLARYMAFIENIRSKPNNINASVEVHHICPKARDMFPEYADLREHRWNGIIMSPREHFIAHLLLWKIYGNKSMTLTVLFMKNVKGMKVTSRVYERLREERSTILKIQNSRINKGRVNVIDAETGSIRKIPVSEFYAHGHKAQHKDTVVVKDGSIKKRICKMDPRLLSGELVGHTAGMTYAIDHDGNGIYVSKTDPRFQTGQIKGNNADTITITDGSVNKRISPNEVIPDGWKRGMTKKSPKGTVWINNGTTSKMVHVSDNIPDGWSFGRFLQKKPRGSLNMQWIHNGEEEKLVHKEDVLPPSWIKGRKPR